MSTLAMPHEVDDLSSSRSSDESEEEGLSDFNESTSPRKRRRTDSLESSSDREAEDKNELGSELSNNDEEERAVAPNVIAKNGVSNGMSRVKASGGSVPALKQDAPIPSTIAEAKEEASLASRTSFATLGVAPWLVASLSAMQIKRPTSIQAGCIPEIIKGRDCIGGSKTGSGKTVAFAVPILHEWSKDPRGIFAVVLTPTRELALQIHEQFMALGAPQSLKSLLITGGADQTAQAISLARNPHVVIATPGRLADHIRTSGAETVAGLRRARYVVLDEADRLLEPGHGSMLPDVETCLAALPPSASRQTCLFTATVTAEVRALKDQPRPKTKPPLFVCELDTAARAPDDGGVLPATLTQTYLLAPLTHRESYLHALLSTPANATASAIVFANRAATAALLAHLLALLGHRVTALHSGLAQRERTANLARFRARAARVLVATDVAARGLDVPAVRLVVNFDVPRDPDDYVHRVGRTARAGAAGRAVTVVGQRDVRLVLAIEARVGAPMAAWAEDDELGRAINIENRVAGDALKLVGEKKREALLQVEQGLDVKGKRKRQRLAPVPHG